MSLVVYYLPLTLKYRLITITWSKLSSGPLRASYFCAKAKRQQQ